MTVPHYGKRNPGSLTASNPGDTLFFAFGSYNDSGDSEALTGLAVGDIEISKNGAAARATDSGYSLISDTGQFGDRTGLYRFSVQLFNTTDDTGFFDEGSWYQVAVDAVTIDGKTVRFWAGSFEIGAERANVVQLDGDTGPADNLGKAFDGTQVPDVNASAISDTGINSRLDEIRADTDTGIQPHDTGEIATAVWNFATRVLTANTNLAGLSVNATRIIGDTGAAAHLAQMADEYDTGRLPAEASATVDTGAVNDAVWNGLRTQHVVAGSFGEYVQANVEYIDADTGKATHLGQLADEHDTGRLQAEASATLDTGAVNQAVWQADAERTLTNLSAASAAQLAQMANEADTGRLQAEATATLDTGAVNQAVWQDDASRVLTANANLEGLAVDVTQLDGDTGFADRLGKFTSLLTGAGQIDTGTGLHDTGATASAVWAKDARTLTAFAFDTGIQQALARVDTGLSETIDRTLAKVDTGVVHDVWGAPTRTLTAFAFDTGVQQRLDRLDTGMSETIDRILADTDTGLKTGLQVHATRISDTGLNERLTAIQNKTDDLTFSVANVVDVNIQYVNDTQVAGTGDTGAGDTWRPA